MYKKQNIFTHFIDTEIIELTSGNQQILKTICSRYEERSNEFQS